METSTNQIQNQQENKPSLVLIITVIVLAVATLVLGYQYYKESKQLTQTTEEKAILEDVKSDLEKQLRDMIVEYDSLKTSDDSLNILLTEEQDKIVRLLRMQASDAEKIRKYQDELETLRNVMRSYIVQIDSLNTRNQLLTEENLQVRQELSSITTEHVELSKTTELLNTQVQLGKVLSAKNIFIEPLNRRERENNRIRNITQIKVCFTIRENAIAEAGTKDIYLRILRPDELVLPNPNGETFEFNGEQMIYSAVRQLDYENMDIDMCIYWDVVAELIEGNYTVILYSEGFEIGSASFSLR